MDFSMPTSPNPSTNVTITKEEFNLFHNIDRQLFTRLVVGLGRDTTQSINVMAFILWVERKSKNSKTVTNLLQWPNEMLNKLADEAVVVLNCIESPESPLEKAIPLVQSIMLFGVTLQYFHEHRMEIINALTKLLNDVCLRAFTDIVLQVQYAKAMKEHEIQLANIYGTMPLHPMQPQQVVVVPQWHNLGGGSSNAPFESHYDASKHMDFNTDISDILAKLGLDDDALNVAVSAEKIEVPVDERTIFLTFSKGYPISNMELRDFFTSLMI
ncbi:hypothetical protein SESBI_48004 [Sesbania bispinosa]|nr:hypothetical protein SESBI_48004 [Sesbania bispinosa]